MENKKNFYIDGKWVSPSSKEEIKVINPATEENCAVISLGNKEDIGGSCIYLASKASNYVIGETIVVDGGWTSVAYGGMMSRHLKEEI